MNSSKDLEALFVNATQELAAQTTPAHIQHLNEGTEFEQTVYTDIPPHLVGKVLHPSEQNAMEDELNATNPDEWLQKNANRAREDVAKLLATIRYLEIALHQSSVAGAMMATTLDQILDLLDGAHDAPRQPVQNMGGLMSALDLLQGESTFDPEEGEEEIEPESLPETVNYGRQITPDPNPIVVEWEKARLSYNPKT